MLRDRFVCGLANLNLQKRLLTEKNLTLERAVSIATAMEMAVLEPRESKKTAGASSYMQDEEINRIEGQRYARCCYCYCCGKRGHMASQCRFRAYKCHKCGKAGHLQAVCLEDKNPQGEKQKSEKQRGQRSSKGIGQLQTDEAVEENHVWVITGGHKEGYRVQVFINGKAMQMELDTGNGISNI